MRYVRPDRYKERPCPGCGAVSPLPEGKICEECKNNLADYERYRPQIELLAKRETSPIFIGDRCFVPRGVKYISRDFGDNDSDRGTEAAAFFGTAMRKLLLETCAHRPARKVQHPDVIFHDQASEARELSDRDGWRASNGTFVEMTDGAREAMHDLYTAINLLLKEAEQDGRERGQNLLQQLAAGEVGAHSFDEHVQDIARVQRECREVAARRTESIERKTKEARRKRR